MDHVAKLAASGLMAAQDMYMLMDTQNGTEPTEAPTAAPKDCPVDDFKKNWFDEPNKQWEFFTLFLIFGFLATWVRRSRNQRAVMLGIGVEGLFAALYFLGGLLSAAIARRCTGGDAPGASLIVTNVFLLLARIGQSTAGFMAQKPNSQKAAGGLMAGASLVYFFTWLTFMASIFNWNFFTALTSPFALSWVPSMAPIGYAMVRSGLIGAAGLIFLIQREGASEEEGVEMP